MVCARDAAHSEDTIGTLVYILTDTPGDIEVGMETLRGMTGKDIVDGLLAYRDSAYKSVANGLGGEGKDGSLVCGS